MLRTTNQFVHVLQVYEGMVLDGIRDERLLFLALIHDLGKLLSLFGEDDANVDGLNERVLTPGTPGGGMESVVTTWNHDEFGYQKLAPYLPRDLAWVVRWHSFSPLVSGDAEAWLTDEERAWLPTLRTLFEYDHKTKSYWRVPDVDYDACRRLVATFLPPEVVF